MTRLQRYTTGSGTAVILAALVLLAVPLAGVLLLNFGTDEGLPDIEFSPEPVILAAQGRSVTEAHPGLAALEWGPALALVAPSWAGTVLDVDVHSGDVIQSGDLIGVIDNINRIAWHTDRPFYRTLTRGSEGSDVVEAQQLLSDAGYYDGEVDGKYGGRTVSAVKAWAADLGVVKPNGSFDPGWIIWLPEPSFIVDVIALTPGAAAPPPGTDVLTGIAPLLNAEVLTIDGEPFNRGPGWVAEYQTTTIPLTANGQIAAVTLETLARALPEVADEISLTLMRAEPLDVVTVPATSIMTNDAGNPCVWVADGNNYQPMPVSVGTATTRVVNVTGIPAGTPVLTNPGQVLEQSACP